MKLLLKFLLLYAICLLGCKHIAINQPPAYQLFLGRVDFVDSIGGENSRTSKGLSVQIFLVNNTNDTLRYISYPGWDDRSFVIDNKELQISSYQKNESVAFDLAPHKSRSAGMELRFVGKPDVVFHVRVGMHLLKKRKVLGYKLSYDSLIRNAPIVWSDAIRMSVDQKHDNVSRSVDTMKKQAKQIFKPLTAEDRGKYVLRVDQAYLLKINKTHNGNLFNYSNFLVPLRLSNRSNDTLKYINFSCDSAYIFTTDNNQIKITGGELCLNNYPMIYKLPPHKDCVFSVRAFYPQWRQSASANIRVGMTICSWGSTDNNYRDLINQFDYFSLISKDPLELPNYTLWSNEIHIPAPKYSR